MSTRCTTHFHRGDRDEADAIVFRHTDGYPSEAGADILNFFTAIEEQSEGDTRFGDSSMLAARYVVFLNQMFAPPGRPLASLGVRVMQQDSSDIEYRYHVYCEGNGRPRVTVDGIYSEKTVTLQEALDGAFNDEDDED